MALAGLLHRVTEAFGRSTAVRKVVPEEQQLTVECNLHGNLAVVKLILEAVLGSQVYRMYFMPASHIMSI